jgi:pimeloyl-ACP methyl ester carboxylesterase
VKPLYFGTSDLPLFGVYEPPTGADCRRGAVLCNAIGQEYYHAHRACRALARRISASGVHVLRFDYVGTGDSAGEVDTFEVGDWVTNIGQAIDELRDMTGLTSVTLVGMRAGAVLAARAAELRDDVDGLVLLDPVTLGDGAAGDRTLPQHFREQLERWGIPGPGAESVPTLLVRTGGPATPGDESPAAGRPSESRYLVRTCPGPAAWTEVADLGGGGLPAAALNEIARWVGDDA